MPTIVGTKTEKPRGLMSAMRTYFRGVFKVAIYAALAAPLTPGSLKNDSRIAESVSRNPRNF